MSNFEKMVDLHIKRDRAKDKVEKLTAKINELQEKLMKEMVEDGITHVNTPRGNLRINRIIRASAGDDMPRLISAMERAGKGDMVSETVNALRLGAWVREFDPGNNLSPEEIAKKLPAPLQDAIKITEQIDIRVTGKKS